MLELIVIAALSHSAPIPSAPITQRLPTSFERTATHERDAELSHTIEATSIAWRNSVEQTSAKLVRDQPFERSVIAKNDERNLTATNTANVDTSYDAILAKRWHWFELYGVTRLHKVPKEARMPWWFSY